MAFVLFVAGVVLMFNSFPIFGFICIIVAILG
jgi:hypothetical protein